MKPGPRLYGLMAEFARPRRRWWRRPRARARRGLPQGGRLLAVPDRGAGGGARLPPVAAAAARPAGRHRRRLSGGYAPAVLGVGDRLPDEHRRPAVPQLAGVHPARPSRRRSWWPRSRRCSACSPSTACPSRTTRCSTCRASRWPAATASSSASRPTTRSSTATHDRALPGEPGPECDRRGRARERHEATDDSRSRERGYAAAVASARCARALGVPAGHARPAAVQAATSRATSSATSAPRGRWSRAPWRAASCARTPRSFTGKVGRRRSWPPCPSPVDAGARAARAASATSIYCAPCHGRGRPRRRHGRAARLPRAAVLPRSTGCARSPTATSST